MTTTSPPPSTGVPPPEPGPDGPDGARPRIVLPSRAIRVGTTAGELLEELHGRRLDENARRWTRASYQSAVRELTDVLPEKLAAELARLTPALQDAPTQAELRLAEAQLVGWLDGLLQSTQVAMAAQQLAIQAERRARQPSDETDTEPSDAYR